MSAPLLELFDGALQAASYGCQDLGLRGALATFDPGQVAGRDTDGVREGAKAVPTQLTPAADSRSVDSHGSTVPNEAQRRNTTKRI
jgi:hypothetical protein